MSDKENVINLDERRRQKLGRIARISTRAPTQDRPVKLAQDILHLCTEKERTYFEIMTALNLAFNAVHKSCSNQYGLASAQEVTREALLISKGYEVIFDHE